MASLDRIEQAKTDFGDLMGQAVYLAERLSEARILVNNDQCARCQKMSFEACKACWLFESARAVREGRHSR